MKTITILGVGSNSVLAGLVLLVSMLGSIGTSLAGVGYEESVALLHSNYGGTGVFSYLAVVEHDPNGATQNTATVKLGDRIHIVEPLHACLL